MRENIELSAANMLLIQAYLQTIVSDKDIFTNRLLQTDHLTVFALTIRFFLTTYRALPNLYNNNNNNNNNKHNCL